MEPARLVPSNCAEYAPQSCGAEGGPEQSIVPLAGPGQTAWIVCRKPLLARISCKMIDTDRDCTRVVTPSAGPACLSAQAGRQIVRGNHEPTPGHRVWDFARLAALALVLLPSPAAAEEPFFKGKTLTIYVGAPVAGGYDTYGRLLSRHIARHIPGNPTVIVSNMPGGSGINCANFLYNVASKDGTAIAILIQTMGEEQGLGTEGIRFDVKRFNWIGRVTSNVEMVYVWHTVPVKTIEDVKKRETVLAGAGPASIIYPLLLNDMIGTRFKLVRGYQGTQNTSLAMQRGEVDGATGSIVAVKTLSNWLTSGEINILTQYAAKRHRELPNVPAVVELTNDPEDKALLSFLVRASEVGRAFTAPPGVPPETISVLRTAFDATMEDPAFLADAKKIRADFDPLPGKELQQVIEQGTELSPANRERANAARRAR